MSTYQFVGVSNGIIVRDYGEHNPGVVSEFIRLEIGPLQAKYGSSAIIVCVDDDRLLDLGDKVDVDDEGIATLLE